VLYRENARVVVEEFQAVALLDQIAVAIISKRNSSFAILLLADAASSCIIRERISVVRLKLSAICPSSCLSTVGGRVADGVIHERFVLVG